MVGARESRTGSSEPYPQPTIAPICYQAGVSAAIVEAGATGASRTICAHLRGAFLVQNFYNIWYTNRMERTIQLRLHTTRHTALAYSDQTPLPPRAQAPVAWLAVCATPSSPPCGTCTTIPAPL